MRCAAALATLFALAFAGCLEDGGGPAPGAPGEDDAPPEETGPVEFRTIDAGAQSGADNPARLVIEDDDAWRAFWQNHTSRQAPPPERPEVDFSAERVVAVVLEDKPNACWAVRITNATREEGAVRVEVTTFAPPPEMFCASVITQPFHIVAAPLGPPVTFEERARIGPPPSQEWKN